MSSVMAPTCSFLKVCGHVDNSFASLSVSWTLSLRPIHGEVVAVGLAGLFPTGQYEVQLLLG